MKIIIAIVLAGMAVGLWAERKEGQWQYQTDPPTQAISPLPNSYDSMTISTDWMATRADGSVCRVGDEFVTLITSVDVKYKQLSTKYICKPFPDEHALGRWIERNCRIEGHQVLNETEVRIRCGEGKQ